mmetsp:Transcript_756/g.901  ORF Transcript_756/g.901 Transcript_756/m.901 type:complete len:381 (-) Transcript_756:30-1172(-)
MIHVYVFFRRNALHKVAVSLLFASSSIQSLTTNHTYSSKISRMSYVSKMDATSGTNMNWSEGKKSADVLEKCFLPLSSKNHKGSSGRIGILGGSEQYTGAPFYAGMSALQCGADLSYIFCAEEAALAIKSYSPELMVTPVYTASRMAKSYDATKEQQKLLVSEMVEKVTQMMDRMHVLVMGPGLGRCPLVLDATAQIMKEAIKRNLPLVVDADALFLLTLDEYKDILSNYEKVVLTPNVVEYKRLLQTHDGDISKATQRGIIVQKGMEDIIFQDSKSVFVCTEPGGLKRSGGLGDVLAGALSTLIAWHEISNQRNNNNEENSISNNNNNLLPLSCWTACCITRRSTARAFAVKRRAMTAPDVLNEIGPAMITMEEEEEGH